MINPVLAQQHDPPQAGDNFIDPALDKFVGTWIWSSGTDTVKIILKKENIQFSGDSYRGDRIIGFHLYKRGTTIVESSIAHQNTNWAANKTTILAGTESDFILTGTFRDLSLSKSVHLLITLNSSHNAIVLKMKEIPGLRHGVRPTTFNTFTIPNNITLTKQ